MNRRVLYVSGALLLLAIFAFAYYAISPLFITLRANEAAPVSDATPRELASAAIVDTPAHPASGTVLVLEADGKTYVRYENYKTINGPDIFVYLAKDLDAQEFVELGRVKATEGNVNYEVPAGVNIADYRYVLTWCKAFGVLFNYADISNEGDSAKDDLNKEV